MGTNTKSRNRKFLLVFAIVVIAIAAGNAVLFMRDKSGVGLVVDSAAENGEISYLNFEEGKAPEVRRISSDGELLGAYQLKSNDSNIYYAYRHVKNYGNKIFFYEYEIDSITYWGRSEQINYYDLDEKQAVTVYQKGFDDDEDLENLNVLSIDVYNNYLYFTSQSGDGKFLTVNRINLTDNSVETHRKINLGREIEISQVYYTRGGDVIFTMPSSEIYIIRNGVLKRIFRPDSFCAINSFTSSPDGDVYFILNEPEGNSIYKSTEDLQGFEKVADVDSDIMSLRVYGDGKYLGVDFNGKFIFLDSGKTIETIKIPLRFLADRTYVLPVVIESVLAYILLYFINLYLIRARITIFQKQLLFSLPVFAAGLYIMLTYSYNGVSKLIEEKTYEKLQLDAVERLNNLDPGIFADIDWASPYEDEDYRRLREAFFELSEYRPLSLYNMRSLGEPPRNTGSFINYWVYWVKDGKAAYIASCDYRYINLPSDYAQEPRSRRMTRFVLENKETAFSKAYDISGEGTWLTIMTPILDAEGNVVSVVEVSCTTTMMEYQVMESVKSIITLTGGIFILILAIFMIILLITLKSLRNLKDAAIELLNGNYGYTVTINSRDEVYDIAQAFNDMSLRTMEKINDLESINKGYYRFIPSAIFEILDKEKIQEVSLGDQRNVETIVITVDATCLEGTISTLTNDEFINYINAFYSSMIPIMGNGGGVIERYSEAGLVGLFTGSPLQSLDAAVAMQKALWEFNRKVSVPDCPPVDMVITLNLCDVLVGIIGDDQRLSTTLVSEQIALAHRIEGICKKFGISIVVTESLKARLTEFSRLNYRLFGYISFKGSVTPVYDFFDGDDYELLYCKKNTLEEFEAAVELYKNGRFYEAKNKFIEVIKLSPYDLASREYLVRCDNNLRDNTVTPEKTYLLEI